MWPEPERALGDFFFHQKALPTTRSFFVFSPDEEKMSRLRNQKMDCLTGSTPRTLMKDINSHTKPQSHKG